MLSVLVPFIVVRVVGLLLVTQLPGLVTRADIPTDEERLEVFFDGRVYCVNPLCERGACLKVRAFAPLTQRTPESLKVVIVAPDQAVVHSLLDGHVLRAMQQ